MTKRGAFVITSLVCVTFFCSVFVFWQNAHLIESCTDGCLRLLEKVHIQDGTSHKSATIGPDEVVSSQPEPIAANKGEAYISTHKNIINAPQSNIVTDIKGPDDNHPPVQKEISKLISQSIVRHEEAPRTHPPVHKRKPLILLYHKLHGAPNWWFSTTEKDFAHCPIQCEVTSNRSLYNQADMVMFEAPRYILSNSGDRIRLQYFNDEGEWPSERGNPHQVRMFFAREPQTSGLSGDKLQFAKSMFNYTTTFQQDADIFYPYGHTQKLPTNQNASVRDFAAGKTRLVLWIVSNCMSQRRMDYKLELDKHIQVDMLGACNKTHGDPCKRNYRCLVELKNKYKFYLAFENTRCHEYITEKFWKALNEGMVPIAMGAAKKTYERVAPPNSFIHVDDFESPQQLAQHLILLDKNSTLYNQYHKWRDTHVIQWDSANCDICRFATEKPHKVTDITKAWNAETQCL